jgi:pimeloyl-ACP methyl ester carboxylesterase
MAIAPLRDSRLILADGRTLAYIDIGESTWPCVMFFGGAPTSRLRAAYLEPHLLEAGIRMVAPERPGYGQSSPQAGRSMADWASDFANLADALAIDRCMVAGHSSGGPYAVACAALQPDRVLAVIVLAGVTDMAWPEAWSGYNAIEAELMRMGDDNAAVAWCEERFGSDGSGFFGAAGFELTAPDEAFLSDAQVAAMLAPARTEAFRQGVTGYAQDIVVQGRPWPFDPGMVRAPCEIVHGDADFLLPMAHSRHTAELIPGSRLRVLPGHGHFTIPSELPTIATRLRD